MELTANFDVFKLIKNNQKSSKFTKKNPKMADLFITVNLFVIKKTYHLFTS